MIDQWILASKSPQRKRILSDMGIRYRAIPPEIDETLAAGKATRPHAVARQIALAKALAIAERHPAEWVMGSDTFVILSDGSISLKPENRAAARKTMMKYRASYCDVYSGLALVNLKRDVSLCEFDKTRVFFHDFPETELEAYLDTDEWVDRSGSMTIEGAAAKFIRRIKGDYWNVVGLPVDLLKRMLNQLEARL